MLRNGSVSLAGGEHAAGLLVAVEASPLVLLAHCLLHRWFLQVGKVALYLTIPAALTFGVAGSPAALETIVKSVSPCPDFSAGGIVVGYVHLEIYRRYERPS